MTFMPPYNSEEQLRYSRLLLYFPEHIYLIYSLNNIFFGEHTNVPFSKHLFDTFLMFEMHFIFSLVQFGN